MLRLMGKIAYGLGYVVGTVKWCFHNKHEANQAVEPPIKWMPDTVSLPQPARLS